MKSTAIFKIIKEVLQIYYTLFKLVFLFFASILSFLISYIQLLITNNFQKIKKVPIYRIKKSFIKTIQHIKKIFLESILIFNGFFIYIWFSIRSFLDLILRVKSKILNQLFTKKTKKRKKKKSKALKLNYKNILLVSFFLCIPFTLFIVAWLFYITIIYTLPEININTLYRPKLTTYIYDREGNLIYKTYLDENRTLIKIEALPEYVKQAFIATEDQNFYKHNGIDFEGMLRAFIQNYKLGQITQGGSTITQQLVKNTILDSSKTYERKLKEAILAYLLEQKYTKNQILEMYLNTVNFGGNAYGIEEASQMYFNKSAKNLKLEEASLLATLPVAPSLYTPYVNKNLAKSRQKEVLNLMYKQGFITESRAVDTYKKPIFIYQKTSEKINPHFVDFVIQSLQQKYGDKILYSSGLKIYTSIDSSLNSKVSQTVLNEINTLGRYKVTNGASLVSVNKTGEILAMVGSKDYYNKDIDGFVNLTTALRQPGSSIKPFNYTLAFSTWLTPSSIIDDSIKTYIIKGSKPWTPKNYDNKTHGKVSAKFALANSLNIPSVKVLEKNGVDNFVEFIKKFGITTWNNKYYGLSLALGAAEVRMVEMNSAYSTFANNGISIPLNPVLYIKTYDNKILEYNPCVYKKSDFKNYKIEQNTNDCGRKAISEELAFLIKTILSDNNLRSTAFGFNSVLNVKGTAVKTGTTNELRDNWTFGFNEKYMVGTWVGNNNNSKMSNIASGITGASPIWAKVITPLTTKDNFLDLSKVPQNFIKVEICPLTNSLACDKCKGVFESFIKGSEPKNKCRDEDIEKILEARKEKTD